MADPFISPLLLTITPALSSKYMNPVLPPYRFSLSDNHSRHYLFTKFWLALLYSCDNHVTAACSRQSVEATTNTANSNNVQVLGTCVVSAVDDSSNWQSQGDTEF